MERKQQEKDLCLRIEQLIGVDVILSNKTKLLCEDCLSFGKKYVDRITDGLYEECENYLKKFSSYEEKEKQFIKSYESNLAVEGKEICKEVDNTDVVNNELLVEKAVIYCDFISRQKDVDPKLVERFNNFKEDVCNFYSYKNNFRNITHNRKEKEKCLDMRGMKIKKL